MKSHWIVNSTTLSGPYYRDITPPLLYMGLIRKGKQRMNTSEMEKTILALQAEVGAISKANFQLNDKISSIKSTLIEKKLKTEFITKKSGLCRQIIFNLESLKMDLQKELHYLLDDGTFHSEYVQYEDDIETLDCQIKELFDEEDE